MQRRTVACVVPVLMALAACGRGAGTGSAAEPAQQPLAAFTARPLILAPAARVRVDSLGVVQGLGGARGAARQLDSLVAATLADRGIGGGWVLPADLWRSYERNRTYATDPYQLAVEPLRVPAFVAGARLAEPIATQLRTMIALHGDARFVFLPIELRFEGTGAAARGVLKAALVDPRFSQATWVGEVRGDPAPEPVRALASVAARLVDLFIAP